ncbi:ABC transporter ATP-binding protein [Embleya sp. AB8]|uniref:ABC transporter ATP-binding protein n=1 Tax=Embleya sp. AB8 TaxID=3156304 RepID=UPI003C76375A
MAAEQAAAARPETTPAPVPEPEPAAAAPSPVPQAPPTPYIRSEERNVKARDSAGGPAVRLDAVGKRYGDLEAVVDVSLTVHRGELFGVLGPNGAGKTTLIEIMEGLRRADTGTAVVLGRSPWPRNMELLPLVGVQTQAAAFFTRLTAAEHLETVAALYGARPGRAREVLDRVGLTDKAQTRVERLSGGQRQRLGIAAALTHDPELLFLDEPTASLDPQARRDLWALLREIRDQGKTIVYTTHHLDEAEALCDRVAIMRAGRVLALDCPQTLVDDLDEPLRLVVPGGRLSAEDARDIAGVDTAVAEGDSVVIATRTLVPVLSAVSARVGESAVRTRAPSLEDVYFRLTGTEFKV